MKQYRKLIAAVVGLGVMIAVDIFGVDAALAAEGAEHIGSAIDSAIALATALGVWGLSND